jgi:hypothetical protein
MNTYETSKSAEPYSAMALIEQHREGMRSILRNFPWRDGDPPAKDILGARLRAKFYGAQVVTYRPFIKEILDRNYAARDSSGNVIPGTMANVGDDFPSGHVFQAAKPASGFSDSTLKWAKLGIDALFYSTESFYAIDKERLRVTNIFGTAHAYVTPQAYP